MLKWVSIGAVCLFLIIGGGNTPFAADRNILDALKDIARYEQQFPAGKSVNKASASRTLKLLNLTQQRLERSADKSSPEWEEANQRLGALQSHLNGTASNSDSQTASKQSPTSSEPAETSKSVDSPKMISQQRVRVKKLKYDIESRTDTLDKAGAKPFQDTAYADKQQTSLDYFSETLTKYESFSEDPEVIAAKVALDKFSKMVGVGQRLAAKEKNALGNVQARLQKIEVSIKGFQVPQTPQTPLAKGAIKAWLTQLAQVRKSAVAAYQPIPDIKKRAYLPNTRQTVSQGGAYDMNDVNRLERSLRGIVGKIDGGLKQFTQNLDLSVQNVAKSLAFYRKFDPADSNDQSNHFLSEGRAEVVRGEFVEKAVLVGEAAEYSKLLKKHNYKDRVALLGSIEVEARLYEANYEKARELVRMPKEASTDSDLADIAEDTLEDAGIEGYDEFERLVITLDLESRSKETSEAKFDKIDVNSSGKVTLSGTKTTYFYDWEEFQVATAEPIGDIYYIFYTTFKKFTKGASTTPLNRWIVSGRFKGSEIPYDNIDED